LIRWFSSPEFTPFLTKQQESWADPFSGNPYLAWAFIEAASFAPRYYPEIQSWYDRKKKKRNTIVAKKALAAKLAKAVWHVMNGAEFKMTMMFG
jgi:hypothetical protein